MKGLKRMLPNFLVIGAQKSGTSFIYNCTREHPDIFAPANEVRFFENPEYLQTDLKWTLLSKHTLSKLMSGSFL